MLAEHAAKIPGQVPLRIVTTQGVDWPTQLAALRTRGLDLEVLHADDPVRNLDDLRRSEAVESKAEVRREAWRQMAALDGESKALRALLPRLQRLAPGRGELQDPRLQDVARIAAAEMAFWNTVLGQAPGVDEPAAPAPLPAATAMRVAPGQADESSLVATALNGARLQIGPRRWIVARTAWDHVRTQCRAVAEHATSVAARTRDEQIAARYRDLAAQCDAVVRELDALLTK